MFFILAYAIHAAEYRMRPVIDHEARQCMNTFPCALTRVKVIFAPWRRIVLLNHNVILCSVHAFMLFISSAIPAPILPFRTSAIAAFCSFVSGLLCRTTTCRVYSLVGFLIMRPS